MFRTYSRYIRKMLSRTVPSTQEELSVLIITIGREDKSLDQIDSVYCLLLHVHQHHHPRSHNVVDFISWTSCGHRPSCADSDPCTSPPACTLSSEEGQKEISLRQPLQVPRPLAVHPRCTRRKHSAKVHSGWCLPPTGR